MGSRILASGCLGVRFSKRLSRKGSCVDWVLSAWYFCAWTLRGLVPFFVSKDSGLKLFGGHRHVVRAVELEV